MRVALQGNIVKEKYGTSSSYNLPPPLGGLNTRDSLAVMQEEDALTLDNWVVRSGECQLRGGYALYAGSGAPKIFKTIFQYSNTAGVKKLFIASDNGIYDVTPGTTVAIMLALTNGYINGLLITNSAGTTYWWFCNGTDLAYMYDGAAWTAPAVTGVVTSSLIYPFLHKRRIYAIEKHSMNVWYLAPDAIQGAATLFPFGALFRRGGYLMSGTSWTLDSGAGPDDLFVLITSEGEIAIYSGTDPGTASTWTLVGVYYVGKPLGRRCFTRIAGDVAVLVESGLYPLSKLLSSGEVNFASALSNKIQPTFTTASARIGPVEGWETVLYPKYDVAIVNVPDPVGAWQLVLNTITGAWSTFSGWDASCFLSYDNSLYWCYAKTDYVYKGWDGDIVADLGKDIVSTAKMAYNYFTKRSSLKHIELLRPLLAYEGAVETRLGVSVDFTRATFRSILPRRDLSVGSEWDVSPWDTSVWATTPTRRKLWQNVNHAPGYALSVWLQTASRDSTLSWSGTDMVLASGGLL